MSKSFINAMTGAHEAQPPFWQIVNVTLKVNKDGDPVTSKMSHLPVIDWPARVVFDNEAKAIEVAILLAKKSPDVTFAITECTHFIRAESLLDNDITHTKINNEG